MIWVFLALAHAHPLAPSLLRLEETPAGVTLTWRTPAVRPVGAGSVVPVIPARCRPAADPETSTHDGAVSTTVRLACDDLVGATLTTEPVPDSGVVVEVVRARGTARGLLTRTRPTFDVPAAPAPFPAFFALGARHLAGGLDHVLLVLGLVLLLGRGRALLHAVTAFTAGHASSCALAALGLLTVPSGPVEVAIAASLVWLASEILTEGGGAIARGPWRVCAPIGVVHGLGFAGALSTAGLPQQAVPTALLAFNLGLEAAQLALVAGALAVGALRPPAWGRTAAAWAIGGLAAAWVLERLLA